MAAGKSTNWPRRFRTLAEGPRSSPGLNVYRDGEDIGGFPEKMISKSMRSPDLFVHQEGISCFFS